MKIPLKILLLSTHLKNPDPVIYRIPFGSTVSKIYKPFLNLRNLSSIHVNVYGQHMTEITVNLRIFSWEIGRLVQNQRINSTNQLKKGISIQQTILIIQTLHSKETGEKILPWISEPPSLKCEICQPSFVFIIIIITNAMVFKYEDEN